MERAIIVRGRLAGPRRIELDEPISEVEGAVEVVVRAVPAAPGPEAGRDVFELIASLPGGTRSKEDIDRQIAEERAGWDEE